MDAGKGKILQLLDGADKRFIIPVYQRQYSWNITHCKQLLNDLMEVRDKKYKSHFFGSIVYVEKNVAGKSEHGIIDGQQRLTTVSLLLLAIRNYLLENNINIEGINVEKIYDSYLTDKYADDNEKKLKLKLVQGDDDAYDNLITKKEKPKEDNCITINYRYFHNELAKMNSSEIKGLYESISKLNIVIITLEPESGDDPQLIFESLNSTGKELEESDKIRNYVLMNLDAKKQTEIYRKYWEILEKKVSKNELTDFIRYFLSIKNRELPSEKKVYYIFKNYREKNNDLDIEEIMKNILVFANYYELIKNAKFSDGGYLEKIARLNKLEVNTVTPLLFDLFIAKDSGKITGDEMKEAVQLIESFMIRRIFSGLSTSPLNKLFVYAGDEIEKYLAKESDVSYLDVFKYVFLSRTKNSRFPNDHEFEDKFTTFELYNVKSSSRKFIFESLENFNSKERIAVEEQIDKGELTIEHVMPQTMTKDWKTYLGDNWELIYTKYQHTPGNLTLTAYNSEYSNLSFDKKLDMADKGIKFSKLKLNEFIKTCSKWSETEIIERAKLLFSWAKSIWMYPETYFEPTVGEEWIGLDEDYEYTNKQIIKMAILGDEYITKDITDAYRKFNSVMYQYDEIAYKKIDSIYIGTSPNQFRKAYMLSENTYIETNIDSQSKITLMRIVFETMGMDLSQDIKLLVRSKKRNPENFDINNSETYVDLTAGKLAYELFKKLLVEQKLSSDDIVNLKDKNYCRQNFKKVVYPVIADKQDDNKGNGKKNRYYSSPIIVSNVKYFISREFFDESRNDLINWFNEHNK